MNFNEIYRLYAPKIFRLCSGYFNDSDMAKDLTQETFIAVWEGLYQFRNESQIGTWIYRIATNKCLRRLRPTKNFPKPISLHNWNLKNSMMKRKSCTSNCSNSSASFRRSTELLFRCISRRFRKRKLRKLLVFPTPMSG